MLILVNALVILADSSTEPVLGVVNTQLPVGGKRRAINLRIVRSLGYHCISGMDFLQFFSLSVDFDHDLWKLAGNAEMRLFANGSDASNHIQDHCSGLSEATKNDRARIDEIVQK